MGPVNLKLKSMVIEKFGTQINAARELGMDEWRLSRIIHGRAAPQPLEKRIIAWKLQRSIGELFPEKSE